MMNSVFDITEYGAVADGVTVNTEAIQRAIDEASERGGRVLVPGGTFLCGSIELKSNIDFHLAPGAVHGMGVASSSPRTGVTSPCPDKAPSMVRVRKS